MTRAIKTHRWMAAVLLLGGGAHADIAPPSQRALMSAVTQYLSNHGDLCVGKFTWPRVVTQEDRLAGTNDSLQLPELERLGLVESTEVTAPPEAMPAQRYSLTGKGKRYYLQKKRLTLGAHDRAVEHDGDLCVAHLTLDRVVKWSPPERVRGQLETMVQYTYRVKPADWMADTGARRVFPVVDRIIRGQGNLLMSVNVRAQDGRWMPVLPTQ